MDEGLVQTYLVLVPVSGTAEHRERRGYYG